MTRMLRTVLLLALCCCAVGLEARSRHDLASSRDVSGKFDYYLLTLSWSPVFCESHSTDPQCGSKRFGFVLHGLWPQVDSAHHLEKCPTSERLTEEARNVGKTVFPTEKLMVHEWVTHGVCSGLSALDYFRTSNQAHKSVRIPPQFEPGTHTRTLTAADVARAIRDANPALTGQSIAVDCSGPELSDVRICLSKDLQPVKCGRGVTSACRTGPIRVPGAH